MPERIQRRRSPGWRMPDGALYVGRPTRWANTFTVVRRGALWTVSAPGEASACWHSTRRDAHADAVDRYAAALTQDDHDVIRTTLMGRDLVCWCPLVDHGGFALACHADVLLTIAARAERTSPRRRPNVTDPSLRSDVVDDDPTFYGEDDA